MTIKVVDLREGKLADGDSEGYSVIALCPISTCSTQLSKRGIGLHAEGLLNGVDIIDFSPPGERDSVENSARIHDECEHRGKGNILIVKYISTLDDREDETGVSIDATKLIRRSREMF